MDTPQSVLDTIANTPQHPQAQYDLDRQLIELKKMAHKLGLYDAADFVHNKRVTRGY